MRDAAEDSSSELLDRSPEEGARRLALAYLDAAAAAMPRLGDRDDDEALHDLRVALRRLRSCLDAYGSQLGDCVPGKLARRLRRLADATGPGRDAEVQLAWLRRQRTDLSRRNHGHRGGLAWMQERLERRQERAYDELRSEVMRDFPRVEKGLRRRLSVYRAEVRLDGLPAPGFGAAAAGIVARHAASLGRRLERIAAAGEVRRAHRARISAKRLRYLAEPLENLLAADRRPAARAGELVRRLKELQDLLGELHDAHVMEAEIAAAVRDAAAERAERLLELTLAAGEIDPGRLRSERRRPQEPALLALARRNRARRDALFGEFAVRWQGEPVAELLAAAGAMAAALRGEEGAAATAPTAFAEAEPAPVVREAGTDAAADGTAADGTPADGREAAGREVAGGAAPGLPGSW
ncbi:MAG TPA: CHAD domain-containing protein [Thermoanaerobaculia bacterium]|nr:CHAD domain-containing protein [Thermoanaerobaculia bacterium]